MQKKTAGRLGALATTVTLLALSGSPALAADPVARASAEAASLNAAGSPVSSGAYAVTNDGSGERASGTNRPPVSVIGGQNFLGLGTLAQDAKTTVTDGAGSSVACAGAAGSGASVVGVGNGSTCLTPGNNVTVNAGTLQLSNLKLDNTGLLQGLDAAVIAGLQPLLNPLDQALSTALTQLGNPNLTFSAGAIQSSCRSDLTSADGTSDLAGVGLNLTIAGQSFALVNFPGKPAVNMPITTDVAGVTQFITTQLTTSINASIASSVNQVPGLGAVLAGLNGGIATLQTQVLNNVLAQLQGPLLNPLAQLVDGTLNKQTRSGNNQIEVTALELRLFQGAAQLGLPGLSARVGTSTCGPSGRVAVAAATPTPSPTKTPTKKPDPSTPRVPTSIPAGMADGPSRNAPLGPWALAGLGTLLVVSVGAGTAAFRKSSARS